MKNSLTIKYNLKNLDLFVARELVTRASTMNIFALQGALGVGKTTISKCFLRQLGVVDVVVSPTFAYVNRYKLSSGHELFHFDLYRIETLEQFFRLGFDEYLQRANSICIIEWPEVVYSLLQTLQGAAGICYIKLEYVDCMDCMSDDRRAIFLESL